MKRSEIVVVGSINMDLIVGVDRFAQPGETIFATDWSVRPGGKGANQAIAGSRLGASVMMFGAVGADSYGSELRSSLLAESVDSRNVHELEGPSGVAVIAVDSRGENTVVVSQGANALLLTHHLDGLPAALKGASFLLLQLEIPCDTALCAARAARDMGVPVMLNAAPMSRWPEPQLAALLELTDVLVVNETEAAMLGATAPTEAGALSLRSLGPAAVVITLGELGAAFASGSGSRSIPSVAVNTVDTVGAGDSFCAQLAISLAEGSDFETAIRLSNIAGALATTKKGSHSSTPTRSEVDQFLGGGREVAHAQ